MRHTRWLFLVAIVFILFLVGSTYVKLKESQEKNIRKPPKLMDASVSGQADDWRYTMLKGDKRVGLVRAQRMRSLNDSPIYELEGVTVELYHNDGKDFDRIESAKAQFNTDTQALYSDGETDITLGTQDASGPKGRLLHIHSSGVQYSKDTGAASTSRFTRFEFDTGSGSSTGAEYNPENHELRLHNNVTLHWHGKTKGAKPLAVQSGEAIYFETASKVVLYPWSKLTRENLQMDAGYSEVQLDKGEIQSAVVHNGHGVQNDPGRKVEYAADDMVLHFGEGMAVQSIHGENHAKLTSTAQAARTNVTSDRMDMAFSVADKESTLTSAVATGHSQIQTDPIPRPGVDPPETKILRSEVVHLTMRPGGREIDHVETDGPGTLDFLPNRPTQPKRFLKGDRIWVTYGKDSRIQSFRSVNASTRTDKPDRDNKPQPPMLTDSKEITATFDPNTSELVRLDQTTNFHYEEGDRRAQADHAILEQDKDLITLEKSARSWDSTRTIVADRIVMNQKTNDATAEGHVASTRLPDHQGNSSSMLSNDEIMQATAQKMTSTNNNKKLHYEGNARAWQGANRVDADRIDIDNEKQFMEAHGKVVSQFIDKSKDDKNSDKGKDAPKANSAPAVFTTVRAPDLEYTGETRMAYYHGGDVLLDRPGLTVNSKELRAFLKPADSDSSLDHAIADGAVKIVSVSTPKKTSQKDSKQKNQKRTRTGTSEHAEYYTDEQKVILEQGQPLLVDTLEGTTTGTRITWWENDDRLSVDGAKGQKAQTVIRKQ